MTVYVTYSRGEIQSQEGPLLVFSKRLKFRSDAERKAARKHLQALADVVFCSDNGYVIDRVRFSDECTECGHVKGDHGCEHRGCGKASPPVDDLRRLMKQYPPLDEGKEPAGEYLNRLTSIWRGVTASVASIREAPAS